MLKIGDKVNDLLGVDETGRELHISDFPGKKIALYFYPKDMTSGCTAQACSLRDHYVELSDKGYQIIGVSVDGEKSHQRFKEKHSLLFPLIADTDHRLVEEFGVWQEKSMYGRKYMGTVRTTFIIGQDHMIEAVITGKAVKTATHGEQLLAL